MLVLNLFISPHAINIVLNICEALLNAQTNHKKQQVVVSSERSIGVSPIICNHQYNNIKSTSDNSNVCVVTVVVDVVACRDGVAEVISNKFFSDQDLNMQ